MRNDSNTFSDGKKKTPTLNPTNAAQFHESVPPTALLTVPNVRLPLKSSVAILGHTRDAGQIALMLETADGTHGGTDRVATPTAQNNPAPRTGSDAGVLQEREHGLLGHAEPVPDLL